MKSTLFTRAWLAVAVIPLITVTLSSKADALPTPPPTPSPSPTPIAKLLDTLVVTAQRHQTRIGSTSREVYVVDAGDLRRLGAQTVAEALRFLPGVIVLQYGPTGAVQTLSLRGANTEQTLVLLDGRPVNELDTGVVDFSSLPVDAVDRVEVVEGGASALYGSAAVGGVINIVTKPWDHYGSDYYVQWGYQGTFSDGLGSSDGDARALAARLDVRMTHAQDVFDYPASAGQLAGTRTNNDAKITDATLNLTRFFGNVRADFHLNDNASNIGVPCSVSCADPLAREQRVIERSDLDLVAPLKRATVTLQLYADDKRDHFIDPFFCFPCDSLVHTIAHGLSLRDTTKVGEAHTVTLGYDSIGAHATFDEDAMICSTCPQYAAQSTTAWYAADEVHASQSPLTVSFGLRDEHVHDVAETTVPNIGIVERLTSLATIKANYARAFRAPNLDELYFPEFGALVVKGGSPLQPEYAATFDVGFYHAYPAGLWSATYFGVDTSNLIIDVCDKTGMICAPRNVARARVRGLSADFQALVAHNWQTKLAYTDYLTAADLSAGASSGIRLQRRPTATGSATIWRDLDRDQYGLDLRFVGRRFDDEANTQLLPAYASLGAHVIRSLGNGRWVSLRVDNLTGERVQDVLGFPVLGRTLTLRLSVTR